MEELKINRLKADGFAKEGLRLIGYPEELEIKTYILDDGEPFYHVYYEHFGKYGEEKHIKPLTKMDYIKMMMLAMEVQGYDIKFIKPVVRQDGISYVVSTNIVSYEGPKKRKH